MSELDCYEMMLHYQGPNMGALKTRFLQTLNEIVAPLSRQHDILEGLVEAYEAKEFVDDSLDAVVLRDEALIESKWAACLKDMQAIAKDET